MWKRKILCGRRQTAWPVGSVSVWDVTLRGRSRQAGSAPRHSLRRKVFVRCLGSDRAQATAQQLEGDFHWL